MKKWPKCSTTMFVKIYLFLNSLKRAAQNFGPLLKSPKNCPIGKNSPNLVTLLGPSQSMFIIFFKVRPFLFFAKTAAWKIILMNVGGPLIEKVRHLREVRLVQALKHTNFNKTPG
jgi:hypothetical protein